MSIHRFNAKRDANDKELAGIARKLGALLWPLSTPCDYLMLWRGRFYAVEIKTDIGKFRPLQVKFIADVEAAGAEVLVWRSSADIVDCLNRLPQQVDQR